MMENISKEILHNIDGYYPIKFADDLRLFCKGRSDAELNIQLPSQFPSAYRRIRIGTSGWEPKSEDKSRFFICLYFIVLTDQSIHSHFPHNHVLFDKVTNFPKIYTMSYMIVPYGILSYLDFKKSNQHELLSIWEYYCSYFIFIEWIKNLPLTCNVDGKKFMRAIINDYQFNSYPEYEFRDGSLHHLEFLLYKKISEVI